MLIDIWALLHTSEEVSYIVNSKIASTYLIQSNQKLVLIDSAIFLKTECSQGMFKPVNTRMWISQWLLNFILYFVNLATTHQLVAAGAL